MIKTKWLFTYSDVARQGHADEARMDKPTPPRLARHPSGRNYQNNYTSGVDSEGFTLVKRKPRIPREPRGNPWTTIPKQNPWTSTARLDYPNKAASNKRHYYDRDQPTIDKKELCWWELRGLCKFGKDCWYSHEKEQPFRSRAQ